MFLGLIKFFDEIKISSMKSFDEINKNEGLKI